MNYRQLTFARELRGYTQTELAKRIQGLSQSNLSKFEKGLLSLSEDVLRRIMDFLNFPFEFLNQSIDNSVRSPHFRKKSSLSASAKGKISRQIALISYVYDSMADNVDFPPIKVAQVDIGGLAPSDEYSPAAQVADYIRGQFALSRTQPVQNLVNLIERNGIGIYEWECEYEEFDGVSLMTDKGLPLIIVNARFSNDRKRFTIAHELGHIVMHNAAFVPADRDVEKEANDFASELLMPRAGIRNSLIGMTLSDLPKLKREWQVSMASILYRAKDLKTITQDRYVYFVKEFGRKGWRSAEPYPVPIDKPQVFDALKDVTLDKLGYTTHEIAESCHISDDLVEDIMKIKNNLIIFNPSR